MRLLLFLPAFSLLLASSSMAAPIVYVEPPDLTSNLANPDHLGPLDLGTNSVTGTLDASFSQSGPCFTFDDDADAFSFQVPAGHVVTSIRLVVTNYTSPAGWTARVRNFSGGTSVNRFSGDVTYPNLVNVGSLGAGTYNLQVHLEPREDDNFDCEGGTQSFNYEFTFEVEAAVPTLPTTWGLIKSRYSS